jgi:hypothetical protein
VVKQILEAAQCLCTAHWCNGSEAPYRKTHTNHPTAIWVRTSLQNYEWTIKYGKSLCREYNFRYGKFHRTERVLDWLSDNPPNIPSIGKTKFALAMPEQYKTQCPIQSYRNYYSNEKTHLAAWKNRPVPEWFLHSQSPNCSIV